MSNWDIMRGFKLRETLKTDVFFDVMPDKKSLEKVERAFQEFPAIATEVLQTSLKKTQSTVLRTTRNELKRNSTLRPAYLTRAVRADKLRQQGNDFSANVMTSRNSLPLIRFATFPDSPPVLRGLPISQRPTTKYMLEKGGTLYTADNINHQPTMLGRGGNFSQGFVQTMKSGHRGVFHRHKTSGDIMQAYGPRINFFLRDDATMARLRQRSGKRFISVFKQEFNLLTGIKV